MRWLVPTASATSRRERPPIPPRASSAISASSSSWRRCSSGGRGTPLAGRLQTLALEPQVLLREPQHEDADDETDRSALLDALLDQRGPVGSRLDPVRRVRRAP